MLSVVEARARILAGLTPKGAETVPLEQGLGRVLAQPLTARRTQPPFPAAAMDGYAVRRDEAAAGMSLSVVGEAAAGAAYPGSLGPGEAVRIFTGAPVPDGADDILIQEDADRAGAQITVREGRDLAPYIRPAGNDFQAGEAAEITGPLTPGDIALLAAMNHAELPVRPRPDVALIPTGDELVLPGQDPGPDQIVTSNNFGLAAMLAQAGARPRLLPIARDTPESLAEVLKLAEGADLIVTLGGASVGDHDLVQSTALSQGLELEFYRIRMRPGKPLMAGRLGGSLMIGLPGNPVSAMVCGVIFVLPAVRTLLGLPPEPPTRQARLTHDLAENGAREHYMRAQLTYDEGMAHVTVFERQDSALLTVYQRANALVLRAPGAPAVGRGTPVTVIPLA